MSEEWKAIKSSAVSSPLSPDDGERPSPQQLAGQADKHESYEVSPNPVMIEREDIHVLFAGEARTKPNHHLGPKLYDYYLLHHIIDGRGLFSTEAKTYTLGPDDAFLIAPNQLVSYQADAAEPWLYQWVAFKGNKIESLIRRAGFTLNSPVAHLEKDSLVSEWLYRIRHDFKQRTAACDMSAAGYLHLIMARYAEVRTDETHDAHLRPEHESEQIVRQMIRMMSTQYAHPFTMEQMATSLGYSRAYLSRLFKQVTEMSPVTFLLKLRIDKGRQLLRERPDLTIEQIASSVGIPDALYFSRQFRRFYQQSPTQYRQQVFGTHL
ncbi:AraC family transcriptional regulator [Paenibacillus sp. 1001270B_150601_E10]|uniref:AraC family transcriptional regulator n=1 Tax=Paenibacillus sp. 1001270B_150601_E10 TaxID=2787079 RepID=UPI0018A01852